MKYTIAKILAMFRVAAAVLLLVPGITLAQEAKDETRATPPSRIKVPQGFKVELLHSVPATEQGSWIALCVDDKGRFYASDQNGGLFRFPAPTVGQTLDPQSIEKVPAKILAVNGMHFADGALFANVNDYTGNYLTGFYKVTDSDGDDRLDKVELLRELPVVGGQRSGGDHGLHGVVPVPGSGDFYLICGNRVAPTQAAANSPTPEIWGEDHLLPRMPDGRGHNRHVLAPGGMIYRVSRDGKHFSLIASGFRNIYDAAVNRAGDLFTYDSDMELDFNTPWYRPTRVNHVVSGADFGWRNGAGKFPEFYADNLPATLNIGPGSPTGAVFGYGAKFPAKYQQAMFVLDWSWGKIHAVHLKPQGASYTATKEEFLTGTPLPVTDVVIHPQDGAMYFSIGGRKVQSGLYRVTYTGSEDTAAVESAQTRRSPAADLRRSLEALHGKRDPAALTAAWPHLSHPDRFVRWAARTVIEHQPVESWKAKALSETDPVGQLEALLALARVGGVCPYHRVPPRPLGVPPGERAIPLAKVPEGATPTPQVDTALRDEIFSALLARDFNALSPESKTTLVRIVQITLNRFGNPDDATIAAIIAKLDPAYPADNFELNGLLTETLAYLQAPNTAAKGMALIAAAESQEPQIEYARSLRFLKTGWTPQLRTQQLEWFLKAANYKGGGSFDKFMEFIRNDSLSSYTDAEKTQFAELIAKKPERKSAIENVGAMFAGRTPTNWTLEELNKAAETGMRGRNFDNGRKMFGAAACFTCHRFDNQGGMTGPDLTQAGGRYSAHDLFDNIINPSKVINEQFATIIVTKNSGEVLSGVIVNLSGDTVDVNTDLSDPGQRLTINRKEIKSIEPSKISPMPQMLLSMLTKDEILDLLAYILSGGDKKHAMFAK